MSDYFSYTTADIVFIDDEFDDTDGLNAAKQKSDGQADNKEMAKEKSDSQGDDKEMATDEKTKEKSDGRGDDKETATDHETMEKSDGQGDDKETATDENTKEKSDDQVITGNKTDSKENETEEDDAGEHDAGEQGNITVTSEHDERQHTSNEGDEKHVHRDEGWTKGRDDKDFLCYLCCEKFYKKAGVRTHYLHAHNMSLKVQEIADDGWPHFIHAIYNYGDKNDAESNVVVDYGDENPWTETLNDKKTKVQGGRGRGREEGEGEGEGEEEEEEVNTRVRGGDSLKMSSHIRGNR